MISDCPQKTCAALCAAALLALAAPSARAQRAESAPAPHTQDIRTAETRAQLERVVATNRSAIELRAEIAAIDEDMKGTAEAIAELRREIELENKRLELERLLNPEAAPVAEAAPIPFPVTAVTRLTMGRVPRVRVRLEGESTPKSLRVGNEVAFDRDGQTGVWRVVSISRDGVRFIHDESGTEQFLAR